MGCREKGNNDMEILMPYAYSHFLRVFPSPFIVEIVVGPEKSQKDWAIRMLRILRISGLFLESVYGEGVIQNS